MIEQVYRAVCRCGVRGPDAPTPPLAETEAMREGWHLDPIAETHTCPACHAKALEAAGQENLF